MIMAVPTREDEDRLDWQENHVVRPTAGRTVARSGASCEGQSGDTGGGSGVVAAACLGCLAGFAVCAVLVLWR